MSNSICMGGMSNYYNSIIQSTQNQRSSGTNNTETKKGFLETVKEKTNISSTTEVSNIISTKDMTLDEYKEYIYNKISDIPIHPSKMCDSRSFSISEAGFEAMQNDPEYEKWVMDKISEILSTGFSAGNRMLTGRICGVTSFGASKDEFRSMSWSEGYQNGNGNKIWEEKSEGAFWTKRAERKEMQERLEEKAYARKLEQQELLEEYIGEQIRHRKEMNQYFNAMHYKNGLATVGMENIAFENSGTSASVVSAAYEANFMMSGVMGNL